MNPIKQFQGEYRFLSNFWPCDILFDGLSYPSTENAFQAAKTNNLLDRARFTEYTSGTAKREGKRLKLRSDWDEVRLQVMYEINRYKYTIHSDLRAKLLATGDAYLMEGNTWHDTYWGVDLESGKGQNHLGKILMRIREELK